MWTTFLTYSFRPEDIAAFVAKHPDLRYDVALQRYNSQAMISRHYSLGDMENVTKLARMLNVSERISLGWHNNHGMVISSPVSSYDFQLSSFPSQHLNKILSTEEMYTFCVSPADAKDPSVSAALLRFASAYSHDGVVPGDLALSPFELSMPETEV